MYTNTEEAKFASEKQMNDYFSRHASMLENKIKSCQDGYILLNKITFSDEALTADQVTKCQLETMILLEPPYNFNADRGLLYSLWTEQQQIFKKKSNRNGGKAGQGGSATGGGKGGGGAGAGNNPQEPKKEPEAPDVRPKLVSFGKMFLSFCAPCLTELAREQGVDEVQVNFYQINESCGPVSLHSIAEFPVVIDIAEQLFADFCNKRGGESMSVLDFIEWASSSIFGDQRSVGYGMRNIYEPKVDPKPDNAEKSDSASDEKKKHMQDWFEKYGTFKAPILTMKMETYYENDSNKLDLLYKLQHRVGVNYNPPPERFNIADPQRKDKRILRIDIYDRTFNPFSKQSKIFKDNDGSYKVFETDVTEDEKRQFILSYAREYAGPGGSTISTQTNVGSTQDVIIDGVVVGKSIPKGVNVLKEFIGETVATLTVGGTNATLIYSAQVQSKSDPLAATIAITGGSWKANSTVAPNALSMAENNLPIRSLPVDVTLTTLGCPIANVFQQYFLDFETGTTIDNLYTSTQVQHNFSPGKFETSWTLKYFDGYAQFFGATSVNDQLRAIGVDTKEKQDAVEAITGNSIDPNNLTNNQQAYLKETISFERT